MALSGSFNTTAYGNRYLTFSWTATQSIEKNESYISWELKGAGTASGYYMAGPFYVAIDGEMVLEQTTRIQLWSGTVVKSGTKTIKHNTNGTRSFSAAVEAGIYYSSINSTGNSSWTLNPIARGASLVSATDFNDESNPSITYNNPAGNIVSSMSAYIYAEDDSTILIGAKPLDMSATSYTFSLTDAERESLRLATTTSNSRTVKFYIASIIDGKTYWSNVINKTFSIINATPTLSPTVRDQGIISTQLTGDPSKVIKGYNTINIETGAQAYKGASIVAERVYCGGKLYILPASHLLDSVESADFIIEVEDSRGNVVSHETTLELIPYIKPTISMTASGELDAETNAIVITLDMEGQCWLGDFGATLNQLSIQRRVKSGSGDWSEWVGIGTVSANSDNTYDTTALIAGLDYQSAHTVQVRIVDSIYTDGVLSDEQVINIIPVFDWGSEDFNFNVPVYIQGNLLADYPIEIGTSSMGSNGTWYWTKWASGKAECYGCRNYGNMAVSSAWGNIYSSSSFEQSLPSGLFATTPLYINIDVVNSSGGGCWVAQGYNNNASSSSTGDFCLYDAVSGNRSQVYIGFNIIGRWK